MITFHILPRKPRLLKLHVLWPPNQSIQRHHYRSCYSHVSTSLPATFRYQLAIDHNLPYSGEHQNSCMILHVHSRNAIAYVPLCHGENTVYGLDRSPSHIGNPRYKNHYRLMTLMTIPKYGDRIYINLPGDHDISWSIPISWDHCKSCLDPPISAGDPHHSRIIAGLIRPLAWQKWVGWRVKYGEIWKVDMHVSRSKIWGYPKNTTKIITARYYSRH